MIGRLRYVAFLRAINVGGRVVKMDALRTLFDGLGFTNVETFIASGNVIFETRSKDTGAMEWRIEQALQRALGYNESKISNAVFERTLKVKATFRGMRTMEKLAAKYPA